MKPEIKKLTHQAFMELPKKKRIHHTVIDLLDEDDNPIHEIPAPKIVCFYRLSSPPITGTEFIEYYYLDSKNRDAWYNFIATKVFLNLNLPPGAAKKKYYHNTDALLFSVGDLIVNQGFFKQHVDLLLKLHKGGKITYSGGGGGMRYAPNSHNPSTLPDWMQFTDIKSKIEKCALRYKIEQTSNGIEIKEYETYDDFLSLCYLQLVRELPKIDNCIICKKLFRMNRSNQIYCSPECSQVPDSRKKSETKDEIHQEFYDLIDEWLGPKQESDWMDGKRLAWDLSEMFSIGLAYQKDLDNKNISAGLRWQFEDNGISLSDNANVTIKSKGREWLINDEDKAYIIKKEEELNIYRKTFLLDKRSPSKSIGTRLNKTEFEDKLKEKKKIIIQTREKRKNDEYKFLRI